MHRPLFITALAGLGAACASTTSDTVGRRDVPVASDARVFDSDFRLGRVGDPDYAPYQPTPVEMIVPP